MNTIFIKTWIYVGTLLGVPGNAPIDKATIIVDSEGKIERIAKGFIEPDNSTARSIIDLKDKFVLPGLIDCHVHLTSEVGGNEAIVEGVTKSIPSLAYQALENAQKTINAGFTTVRNLGDTDGIILALRDAINAKKIIGPKILDSGMALSATAGHMDTNLGFKDELRTHLPNSEVNICDGVESCRKATRLQISKGVDLIKIGITGGVNSKIGLGLGLQMFKDEAEAIIHTAKLYGKKVAVHAHGSDGIAMAIKLGADSIEHGTIIDDNIVSLFLKYKTFYVPTLSTVNGYIERLEKNGNAYTKEVREKIEWRIKVTGDSVKKMYPKGVRIAFGTDAGVSKHGKNADEFELMVKYGMSNSDAIKSATLNAAELLGLSQELGSIEEGKRADIIAVDGNPLKDVTVLKNVKFVMVNGVVAKSENLNSELR